METAHYSKSYISQMFWSKKSCMKKLRMVCDFWDELRLRIQSQAQRHKFPEPKERQSNTNEIIWLKKCLKKFRPKYYKRFVDDILKNLSIYNDFLHIAKAYLNINSVRNTETQSRFFWRRLYGLLRFVWYYRLKLTIFFLLQFFTIGFAHDADLADVANGLVYVREDIPTKLLNVDYNQISTENLTIEWNLRNSKWTVLCSYNPPKNITSYRMETASKYSKHLFAEDFKSDWLCDESLLELWR